MSSTLPYKIAVLCYIYDGDGHVLLLHRSKAPNAGMYSPVGGKLEVRLGEGPHECAIREIAEEVGLTIPAEQVRLTGIVSERAYEGHAHWLIFLFEVTRAIRHDEITRLEFDEGRLEWVPIDRVVDYPIPRTDQDVMWPLVQSHREGFFMVHIDCSGETPTWTVHEQG